MATRHGTPIRVADLGTVVIGERLRLGRVGLTLPEAGKAFAAADHDDVVQGIVLLRRGENPLDVLARVRDKVAEINAHDLPPGVRMVPHYDRTELIERDAPHGARTTCSRASASSSSSSCCSSVSATGVPR